MSQFFTMLESKSSCSNCHSFAYCHTPIAMMRLLLLLCFFVSCSALAPQPPSRRAFVQQQAAKASAAVVGATIASANTNLLPASAAAAGTPLTGAMAPAFELPNSRGEGATSLSQLIQSRKWTVLYFYPAAFTSGTYVCFD